MKRPQSIEGRIRYYGLMMAELTADLLSKGIQVSYAVSTRYVSLHFWEAFDTDNPKITHTESASFDNNRQLNEFEQFIETTVAELTGQEVQL